MPELRTFSGIHAPAGAAHRSGAVRSQLGLAPERKRLRTVRLPKKKCTDAGSEVGFSEKLAPPPADRSAWRMAAKAGLADPSRRIMPHSFRPCFSFIGGQDEGEGAGRAEAPEQNLRLRHEFRPDHLLLRRLDAVGAAGSASAALPSA